MLKISKAIKDEVMDFNEAEWEEVNDNHFGRGVHWNEAPFFYKATENGKVVGLIFGKHVSGTVYVSNIIVAKNRRRRKIGTKLIKKTEELGRKYGDHKLWLISGKNYPEDPFFTALGFRKQATLPNHFFHQDFLVYIKEI